MEILKLTEETLTNAVRKAATVLKKGGIVLFPTDTLYGLAVDARNIRAIERLKQLKARQVRKPISVIVSSPDHLEQHGVMNDVARALAQKHLPGPLTIVVPASGSVARELELNGTLGLRVPNDPFSLALAEELGQPYTATSANMTGLPTPSHVHGILEQFGLSARHIDLVIDAGVRDSVHPSTVVAVVGDAVYVLREGAIKKDELGI